MIDWTRLSELRGEIGEDDFDEVVRMFLEEVDEVLDRLRSNPAPNTLEADLHFLKSSALNLGFSDFAHLCSIGETRARDAQSVNLDVIFSSYDASCKAMAAGGLT